MKGKIQMDALTRGWVHSHEEDSEAQMVFRPLEYPFPRSRGRSQYTLKKDGTLVAQVPGPTDRRETLMGSWVANQNGELKFSFPGKETRRYVIASLSNDRLVLEKPAWAKSDPQ